MCNIPDSKIRLTLSSLESQFFLAIQKGTDALLDFHTSWAAFGDSVAPCVDDLHEETKSMIHSFAETTATVASALLEVDISSDKIHSEMEQDLTKILNVEFGRMTIEERPVPGQEVSMQAPYIMPCYTWLLENLHNPYPPRQVRSAISRATGSPSKDIDAWFIEVRKRIGWNAIRKTYFPRRSDLVEAASRHFDRSKAHTTPSKTPSFEKKADPNGDLPGRFATMEHRAKALYPGKLPELPRCTRSLTMSPSSPEPSTDSSVELRSPIAMQNPSRNLKRRSSSSSCSSDIEDRIPVPKRSRLSSKEVIHRLVSLTPSSSAEEDSGLTPPVVSEPATYVDVHSFTSRKRKRCSSDYTTTRPAKQPRSTSSVHQTSPPDSPMPSTPPEIRSDPSLFAWFKDVFGAEPEFKNVLPEPVSVVVQDAQQLEVDCYQYASSPSGTDTSLDSYPSSYQDDIIYATSASFDLPVSFPGSTSDAASTPGTSATNFYDNDHIGYPPANGEYDLSGDDWGSDLSWLLSDSVNCPPPTSRTDLVPWITSGHLTSDIKHTSSNDDASGALYFPSALTSADTRVFPDQSVLPAWLYTKFNASDCNLKSLLPETQPLRICLAV